MAQETCTIWVCQDCILHHANGECGGCYISDDPGFGHDREPMGLHHPKDVTMGMSYSEHAEDCPKRRYAGLAGGYECDCETITFSWSSCEGCGSSLGGERNAMTLWFDA